MVEQDLFLIWIAGHFDIHCSIAGSDSLANRPAGHDTAEAVPRYNFSLKPVR